MSDDATWFHDPTRLRERAILYDQYALANYRTSEFAVAGAWESKARALRSRARVIERQT